MDDDARTREPRRSSGPRSREVREEAARLRREGLTKPAIAEVLGVHPKTLQAWFRADGVPALRPQRSPEVLAREAARAERRAQRTGRPFPGGKGHPPELRERAAALRREGVGRAEIARQLQVGASTVARWFRQEGVGLVAGGLTGRAAAVAAYRRVIDERWAAQDAEQAEHSRAVGPLSDRELRLVGAALYWAEGTKAKPWRRDHRVTLVNSDADVLRLFIAALEQLGVSRSDIACRLQIHQTADVQAAQVWWQEQVGADLLFHRPSLKRHVPVTTRHNTGETYRGCLAVVVYDGARIYRQLVGTWQGVAQHFRSARSPVV